MIQPRVIPRSHRRLGLLITIFCLALPIPLYLVGQNDETLPLPSLFPPAATTAPPTTSLDPTPPPIPLPIPSVRPSVARPAPSSTSTTGQFIVHGPELRLRSSLASLCQQISDDMDRLLRTPEPWVYPVVVMVQPPPTASPAQQMIVSQISQMTHGGFHLQLNVPYREGIKPDDFKKELVQLLIAERVLKHQRNPIDEKDLTLPSWVLTGVLEALEFRHRARPSAVFAAIFKSGRIYGIEEILEARPHNLDGLSRTIFETSCCALLLALLDQPEGPLRFSRYLAGLPSNQKSERDLLIQWFPAMGESSASLDKWWSLQLASLAAPTASESLDPTTTAELLDQALTFLVPATTSGLPAPRQVVAIHSTPPLDLTPSPPTPTPPAVTRTAPPPKKPSPPPSTPPKPKPVAQVEPPEPQPAPSDPPRIGLIRRWLRIGTDKEAESENPTTDGGAPDPVEEETEVSPEEDKTISKPPEPTKEKARVVPEKTQPEKKDRIEETPSSPPSATPEKKGRFTPAIPLNPLRWFKGKKAEDEGEDEVPKKEITEQRATSGLRDPAPWLDSDHGWTPFASQILLPDRRWIQQERSTPVPTIEPTPIPVPPTLEAPLLPTPSPELPATTSTLSPNLAYPIEDYATLVKLPEHKEIFETAILRLGNIASRGNVVFREVAQGYSKALSDIMIGKTKGMDERLKQLREQAVEAFQKARAVRDHVDWFEATRSPQPSGLFDDFLDLPNQLERELPARTDPLSVYLDSIDARFSGR